MTNNDTIQLGVNVDHIATLRQARGTTYPDPMRAAEIAKNAGADGITVHLREDRRHIQDFDVINIKQNIDLPLNLEMAMTDEMLNIAKSVIPHECCLVPESRQEITTEGGLNVTNQLSDLKDYIAELKSVDILVSLFIDPDPEQIQASKEVGADIIELHTGNYADSDASQQPQQLSKIIEASQLGHKIGLQVNAGHGLHYKNVTAIAQIPEIVCLNIGHAIIAEASYIGLYDAVASMQQLMVKARRGDA